MILCTGNQEGGSSTDIRLLLATCRLVFCGRRCWPPSCGARVYCSGGCVVEEVRASCSIRRQSAGGVRNLGRAEADLRAGGGTNGLVCEAKGCGLSVRPGQRTNRSQRDDQETKLKGGGDQPSWTRKPERRFKCSSCGDGANIGATGARVWPTASDERRKQTPPRGHLADRRGVQGRFSYDEKSIASRRGATENRIRNANSNLYCRSYHRQRPMRGQPGALWFDSMAYVLLLCPCAASDLHGHRNTPRRTCGTFRLKLLKIGCSRAHRACADQVAMAIRIRPAAPQPGGSRAVPPRRSEICRASPA